MQLILVGRRSCPWPSGVAHRHPAADHHPRQRGRRPAPGGQGRERHERAQVDDEGDGPGAPRRHRGRDPGRGADRRRRRAARRPATRCRPMGGITEANPLQIDESALTGESVPAQQGRGDVARRQELGPGDQTNMAFMHTPVTHGSGVMIVTTTGGHTQVGRIAHLLSATDEGGDAAHDASSTRMTLWIAAVAGVTMLIMFALGLSRGTSRSTPCSSPPSHWRSRRFRRRCRRSSRSILSHGRVELAKRKAIVKDLAVGRDARVPPRRSTPTRPVR